MKIPLRELEQVRQDPRGYLRKRERPSGEFFGKSKYRTLQRAALHYHDSKGDIEKARQYLKTAYEKQFKNQNTLQSSLEKLENYAVAFQRLGNSVFKVRDQLSLILPEAISREISLTAQIPRLDLTARGYAVWLFSKEPVNLRNELRLPLIQETYSKKLSAELDEITVGVYDFATASYESYSFSRRELNKATLELGQLVDRLVAMAKPKTLREL